MDNIIAITGATGFIGRALAQRLAAAGWHVRALVRAASYPLRPQDFAAEWVVGELQDPETLQRLVADTTAVVHCAGAVRGAVQNDFDRVNVDGTRQLVRTAAMQEKVPRFLLISSLAAREPQLSHYAASKRRAEEALAVYSGDMFWGAFRPPAVYGPGDREMRPLFQWMFRGVAPLIGADHSRVSLLYVEDLAGAVIGWLNNGWQQQKIFELHDGKLQGYSWQEIIEVVEQIRGKTIHRVTIPASVIDLLAAFNLLSRKVFGGMPMLTPGKVRELTHPDWVADNSQLSLETGWKPEVSLMEGLKRTFA